MYCPGCRHENLPAAEFCQQCGARLGAVCARCGVELLPTAKFCHECGASQSSPSPPSLQEQFAALQQDMPSQLRDQILTPAEGENRLVTVLFADMSRSLQAMLHLHPEEAADLVNRLVRAMMEVLLKYEGRMNRFLGDGVLAVFGVPQASESDPERALLAALEIRAAAQRLGLEVTAGINTGEVYIGGMGAEGHEELTVMGPVVHLASRLQGQAGPGQILIGEATHRHTRRAFAFNRLSLAVKGIAEPVTAYAVIRALPKPEKTRGIEGMRAALIGRDAELAELRAAMERVLQGRGQIVSVVGEAGVGKSRLVTELKELVNGDWTTPGARSDPPLTPHPSPPLWLEGRCLEFATTSSYSLFVDLFRRYFAERSEQAGRWSDESSPMGRESRSASEGSWPTARPSEPSTAESLQAAMRELVEGDVLSQERSEQIEPVLGNLLSLHAPQEWAERLKSASPEQVRHQTFGAVHDLLVAMARQRLVVLVLEDLHWIDSLSLELIFHLIGVLSQVPLLLIGVHRPEPQHLDQRLAALAAKELAGCFTEIHLGELTPAQSRELVESLLQRSSLPSAVWGTILEKTHGNPFFVEEVVHSLIASGLIYRDGEVWRARDTIAATTVPETIQSVILSRVDRLSRDLQQVLQCASVIGRVFRPSVLEPLTQAGPRLRRTLAELERHGLIYQERGGEEFWFKHVLTQETVYETLLRRRRAGLHQKVAEAMEALYAGRLDEFAEELARHYTLSGCLPKAVEYLLKAAQKAMRLYANQEAIHYFESALRCLHQLPPDAADRRAERIAHEGLGDVLFRTGNHPGAETRFQMALNLCEEADERQFAGLAAKLADAIHWQVQPRRAIEIAQAGLAALGGNQANPEAVALLEVMARACRDSGDLAGEQRQVDQLQAILPRMPYFGALYMSYYTLAWSKIRARQYDAAERWLKEMESVCSEHEDENGLARCYHGLGDLWRERGDHQQSGDWFAKSLASCERTGDAHLLLEGHLERAHALIMLDADPEAIDRHIQRGTAIAREMAGTQAVSSLPNLLALLGDGYAARNDPEKAMQYYRQAIDSGANPCWRAVLGKLERLYAIAGQNEAFRAYCRYAQTRALHGASPLQFWHLTPRAGKRAFTGPAWEDAFETVSLDEQWQWTDPGGQSTGETHPREGLLVVRTPAALGPIIATAPRLLRPAKGDFAAETVLVGAEEGESHTAGLLLWASPEEYLFFGKGDALIHEVRLEVCRQGRRQTISRGWLPGPDLHLRLERLGDQVSPLCSSDGRDWHGWDEPCIFPEGDVDVGLLVACPTALMPGCVARFRGFSLFFPETP